MQTEYEKYNFKIVIWIALIFLIPMIIFPASSLFESDIVIQQRAGGSGSGGMNQTPNQTPNMTPNMTAGVDTSATWNISYYLRDNTRTLTTEKVRRDVDNDLLSLYGGNAIAGGTGGIISLYGKNTVNPNSVEVVVGNGGIGNTLVTGWVGGAHPFMNMNGYNISNLLNPVGNQDAVTLNYLNSFPIINTTYDLISNQSVVNQTIQGQLAGKESTLTKNNLAATSPIVASNTSKVIGNPVTLTIVNDAAATITQFDTSALSNLDTDVPTSKAVTTKLGSYALDANVIKKDGSVAFTANMSMGGFNISRVLDPVAAHDATTLNYENNRAIVNDSYVLLSNGSYVLISNISYAHLTAGKVPTTELGGAGADATKYLRGDQSWQVPSGGSNPTAVTTTLLYSDLYEAGLTTAIPGLTGLAISSGTATVLATTANHPGVIVLTDSASANGGFKYGCVGTQLIGGGETFEVVFQAIGYRTKQGTQMGWSDTAAANTYPVDGVYFNISGTGAAITLRGNTSSNSVRNGTATTYAPTTGTWYRGTIAVNSVATLTTFTIYNEAGVQQWTDSVPNNIPTGAGRDTSPCIIVAESSTDAGANILVLDYVKWGTTRTLVR